jgi:hypothetical protein
MESLNKRLELSGCAERRIEPVRIDDVVAMHRSFSRSENRRSVQMADTEPV